MWINCFFKNGEDSSKKKQQLARLEDQLIKLKCAKTDREENKEIALGTSKLNYLDPRITIGWAKKWDVPIEKVGLLLDRWYVLEQVDNCHFNSVNLK